MRNQRGEVVTGLMVIMMGVMMIFSGMHMMHGEHRAERDHTQVERERGHDKGMQHMHDNDDEQAVVSDRMENK